MEHIPQLPQVLACLPRAPIEADQGYHSVQGALGIDETRPVQHGTEMFVYLYPHVEELDIHPGIARGRCVGPLKSMIGPCLVHKYVTRCKQLVLLAKLLVPSNP